MLQQRPYHIMKAIADDILMTVSRDNTGLDYTSSCHFREYICSCHMAYGIHYAQRPIIIIKMKT